MEVSKVYTAKVSRDEDAWMVEVPEVERVTQALTLRQVEPMARDLIAIMDEVDPNSVELRIEWPADIAPSLGEYRAAKAEAEAAADRERKARRAAALTLSASGATVRDIGAMMGISHQRAQQILDEARESA